MPTYRAGDLTDMGSLTVFETTGRFQFSRREQVRRIKVGFTGGSGTADILFYKHKRVDGVWGQRLLWTEAARGVGADCNVVIPPGDAREADWIMDGDNDLVAVWANPASGTMQWVMEVETEVL